jgi:integrase
MWYSGARIGEIAAIYKKNIILDAPIPYFNFEHQENRLLKNDESIRQVPIHPACMPYVEHLFFSRAKTPGRSWSERFKTQLQLPEGEAAHSLRHNITTRFNRAGVLERVQDAILGHASPGHGAGYGEIEMETKLEAIRKLR